MNKLGSYTLAAASAYADRSTQYLTFFTDIFGAEYPFVIEENIIWLDDAKTIGFKPNSRGEQYGGLHIVYKYNGLASTGDHIGNNNMLYGRAINVNYGVSRDKNVIYYLEYYDTSTFNVYIAAKDKNNEWTCFTDNKIFDKNGVHDYSAYCNIFNSADFVAAKAASANGAEFYELYKMLYATSFPDIANTRIKAGNTVYAVVPTYFPNNVWYPSFCFPLFDEN